MPIINRFDGGLVTGLDPVYLAPHQSTVLLDACIERMGLSSAKEPVLHSDGDRSFYQFPILDSEPEAFHVTSSKNFRSYAEFQGALLYSDGGPVCQTTNGSMSDDVDDFKWVTLGTEKAEGTIVARPITVEDDIIGSDVQATVYSSPGTGHITQEVIRYRLVDDVGTVYMHAVTNNSGYATVSWDLPEDKYSIYREELNYYGFPSDRYVLVYEPTVVSTQAVVFVDGTSPLASDIIYSPDNKVPDFAGHRMSNLEGVSWTSPYTVTRTDGSVRLTVSSIMGIDKDSSWKTTEFNESIQLETDVTDVVGIASTFVFADQLYVQMALGNLTKIYRSDGVLAFDSTIEMDAEFFKGTTVEHNSLLYMFNPRDGKVAIFDGSVIEYKDTEVFPYALAEDTVYALKDSIIYAVINGRHESNIRSITLPDLVFGYTGDERIETPLVRGLGGTSNSILVDGDEVAFPLHNGAIRFAPYTNMVVIPEGEIPESGAYSIKGFAACEQCVHAIQGNEFETLLDTWEIPVSTRAIGDYFNERTLTGTYVYTVAQKTPDGTSEGPIMDTESEPVSVYKGHVTIDLSGVTHTQALRLYRTGGYLTRFTMVEDVDPTDTYIDKRDDVTIALGRNGHYDFVDAPPEGLQYLTSHRGRVFGAVGSNLYWSEAGDANAWDELLSFVIMDRKVTGVASCVNGLLIFMQGRINLLLGDSRNSFSMRTVSVEKGTLDSYSIQEAANGAFFFSEDGLCFTDGAQIQELSYNILGPQKFDVVHSAATNRSYYALIKGFTDGRVNKYLNIIRYDFGKEPVFSMLNGDEVSGLGTIFGRIAHSSHGKIYDTLAGTARKLNYKSGNITEGIPTMIKEWDRVRVAGEFVGTLFIYIENKLSLSKDIILYRDELVNVHIPKNANKGKTIAFELVGRGCISSIEYSITPRKTTK